MIGTDSRILTGRITTISQFIEEGLVEEEEEESNAVVRNEVVGNVSEWLEALADIDSIDTERGRSLHVVHLGALGALALMRQLAVLLRLQASREGEVDHVAQTLEELIAQARDEERQDADDERADTHHPDHEGLEHGVL